MTKLISLFKSVAQLPRLVMASFTSDVKVPVMKGSRTYHLTLGDLASWAAASPTPIELGTVAGLDVGTGVDQVPITGDYVPAYGAPAVVEATLAAAGSCELDIVDGIYQSVTFNADPGIRTLTAKVATPEPTDGQRMYVRVVTGAGGGTLKLATGISVPSLSPTNWAGVGYALAAGKTYELLFMYNTTINKWQYLSFTGGFAA